MVINYLAIVKLFLKFIHIKLSVSYVLSKISFELSIIECFMLPLHWMLTFQMEPVDFDDGLLEDDEM